MPQNECIERFIPQYSEVGNPTVVRTGTQKIKPLNSGRPQVLTGSGPSTDFQASRPVTQGGNIPQNIQPIQNTPTNSNYNNNDEVRQPSISLQNPQNYNLQPNGSPQIGNTNQRLKPQYNPTQLSSQNNHQSNFEQQPQTLQNNRQNTFKFTDYAPITKFAWTLFKVI